LKAYSIYKNKFQFSAILLFIILFVAACSSTKFILPEQSIVRKVEIDSIPSKYKEESLNYIQKDIRPASKLGINVGLYNIFYSLFKIKSVGQPAPVLDSTLVEISRNQIEKYLVSKGYFMAKVKSEIRVKKQRAEVDFKVKSGPAFSIAKVDYNIADSTLREIYMGRKAAFSHLHPEMQYDDDSLAYEREQIYQVMKENGYYDFSRPYVRFTVDSALNKSATNVVLYIDDPDSTKHVRYSIGQSNVLVAPTTEGFPERDSIKLNPRTFRGIRYTDLSKRFRRNPVVRYDFLRQGETYDISKENLTYDRLYELNVFKNVKIDYIKNKDSAGKLDPVIQLTPQKRMSNRIEGEIPFNAGTIGFTLSNTYTNNNIFRGAERFEFQVKGGLQSRIGEGSLFSDIYQRDFSLSANLAVPRLMVPFDIPMMGKNGMPYTVFSSSYVYSLQKDFFARRVFLNSVTYNWVETKSKLHSFTPLNFEYRVGTLLIDSTTTDGQQLIANNSYNIRLLSRKDITLGIKYAYTLNGNKLLLGKSFVYFRGNVDMAGNMLQGISKLTGNGNHDPASGDYGTILGLPYNQYIRPEIDLRWYKNLGPDKQFIARINGGVGYAYGNSTAIPFEKLFFAGGSSGVRAWQARTLGPGNYNRGERVTSEEVRKTLYGIDQLGQMHIEANLEYRYRLIDNFFGAKLNGAVFLDAGNVWNIAPGNSQPETYFDFKNLGNQIGVGTGMGFRYDLQYFVFRFDVGVKLRDPQFDPSEQWVIKKLFSGTKEFKNSYSLLNSPDDYHFLQYNFGIGLPF
jgi:outer membrane protein insertion porin family